MWKDINEWEDLYEVNEFGEVRNKKTGHILVGDVNNAGYYRVSLYGKDKNLKNKKFFRHRLVAMHFLNNPNNYSEVNHRDGNKSNNHVSNLEWTSRSGNEQHARQNGLKTFKENSMFKKNRIEVEFLNKDKKIFESQAECAKELKISPMIISNFINGKRSIKCLNKYGIFNIKVI